MDWTDDIEQVLDKIRQNCNLFEENHKRLYIDCKNKLRFFRIPIIVISGVNSIVAVSLQTWVEQDTISMANCLLSLSCGLIGAVELYLGINKTMELHLASARQYYILGTDIYKTLLLSKCHRPIPAKEYLDEVFNSYIKYYENSVLLHRAFVDKLQSSVLSQATVVD